MLVTTTQLIRRTIVAATFLVPVVLANSALSWTGTAPANSPSMSSSRIPLQVSEYKNYRLKLSPFVPSPARTRGVLLTAHINRGPALSLLLDSGARDLVLNDKVARRSGIIASSMVDLVCIGQSSIRRVPTGMAATLDIDQLSMANVPVVIVSSGLAEGIDGIVPMAIFSRFLIQINFPEKAVDLVPYPAHGSVDARGNAVPTRLHNGILFLAGTIDSKQGYLMIDTGAAYNAISRPVADNLRLAAPPSTLVYLATPNGLVQGQLGTLSGLRIGDQSAIMGSPIIVNLDTLSRFHGIEIIGLVGFPAFEHSSITIDYRDRLVRFAPE
jgi:predicted aspartyl protease